MYDVISTQSRYNKYYLQYGLIYSNIYSIIYMMSMINEIMYLRSFRHPYSLTNYSAILIIAHGKKIILSTLVMTATAN